MGKEVLHRNADLQVGLKEQLDRRPERETDDVAVASVVALDGPERFVLDGVGAGLIERVAARDRSFNFGVGVIAHDDSRHRMTNERRAPAGAHYGHSRSDLVRAPTQKFQHPPGVLCVSRLSENRPIDRDHCIGRDYYGLRVDQPGRLGFRARKTAGDDLRISTRGSPFVQVDRSYHERQLQAGEQLLPAWRGRSEDELTQTGTGPLASLASASKNCHALDVIRLREHVDGRDLPQFVAAVHEDPQVAGER